METNQTTPTTTTQQPTTNKKMMNCKTCGSPMAKSAKKCPSCGAKNKKRKLKKLLVFIVIILVLFSASKILNQPKKAEIGETYTTNGLEFTVESVSFYRGAKTGISEVDNSPCLAIEGIFENKGKNQKIVSGDDFLVDFDNGYEFSSNYMYLESSSYIDVSGNEQESFKLYEGGVSLTPLESGVQEFKMLIPVPDTVFESGDKPIKIEVFNYEYEFDNVSAIENSREDTIDRLSDALSD